MTFFIFIGLLAIASGCVGIYLASPHQSWCAVSWPRLPARSVGVFLLLLGWSSLLQAMHGLTAFFVLCTTLMWVFVALPYVGALAHLGCK